METKKTPKGVCSGFLMPHPPIIVQAVGKGRERDAAATVAACKRVAERIAEIAPETIVVISPHSPLFSDFLFIHDKPILSGSFETFGAPETRLSIPQDGPYREVFQKKLDKAGIPAGSIDITQIKRYGLADGLDHGVLVPLTFILASYDAYNLVALSSSAFEGETLARCGAFLAEAAFETGRRVCIIASGDMSHRVSSASPYGRAEEGAKFDHRIQKAIESSDLGAIRAIDHTFREKAGECGYNSLVMALAAMERAAALSYPDAPPEVTGSVLSYEAPFGIGYCVAEFGFSGEEAV